MQKKFAINLIADVADKCEQRMNSYTVSEEHADVLDNVSDLLTKTILELFSIQDLDK